MREGLDAFNARNMERLWALYDPEVVMRLPKGWPEPGPFVGRDAVFQQFHRVREAWDQDSFEVLANFLATGERVIVRVAGHGSGHGPDGRFELTISYAVRAGFIFGLDIFWDHGEALEAAGFRE